MEIYNSCTMSIRFTQIIHKLFTIVRHHFCFKMDFLLVWQIVSSQFVKDNIIGAQVLGLYGLGGIGKTTLAGALCDYFYNDFGNRTCHVELGGASKTLKRQKMVLGRLCEFEKDVLDRITNVDKVIQFLSSILNKIFGIMYCVIFMRLLFY